MEKLFSLKDPKHNFHLLAFQFHTLDYSVGMLKSKKKELKNNPILKHKIDNYLLMERLSLSQELSGEVLPFDVKANIKNYLNNPNNKDLRDYMNLSKHIVARELDMAELCSKIDFNGHLFVLEGKDLFCVDSPLSTAGTLYNDIEREFLCSCARRGKRIVKVNSGNDNSRVSSIYNSNSENNNLIRVA